MQGSAMKLVYTAQASKEPTPLRDVYVNATSSLPHKVIWECPQRVEQFRLGRGSMKWLGQPSGRSHLSESGRTGSRVQVNRGPGEARDKGVVGVAGVLDGLKDGIGGGEDEAGEVAWGPEGLGRLRT